MEISINQYKGSQIEKGFVNQINEKPSIEEIEKALENNLEKGLISEDLFNKAMDELDLIKGGEGSKGGKVIGHTKSGKPIYDKSNHKEHKNFNSDEHRDALLLNESLWKKANHEGRTDDREHHDKLENQHRKLMNSTAQDEREQAANIDYKKENTSHLSKIEDKMHELADKKGGSYEGNKHGVFIDKFIKKHTGNESDKYGGKNWIEDVHKDIKDHKKSYRDLKKHLNK